MFGISTVRLDVDWTDTAKFERLKVEKLLMEETEPESGPSNLATITPPVGVCKDSAKSYKFMFEASE